MENLEIREELNEIKANLGTMVDDAVATMVNMIISAIVTSLTDYIKGGQQGPLPVFSMGGSHSGTMPQNNQNELVRQRDPTANPNSGRHQTPTANPNARADEESPASIVSSMPVGRGPSTLAELNALRVIKQIGRAHV